MECDRQCQTHQLTFSWRAVLPLPMQFLSFNVTPFLPAESIISDYVSVKVFSARLSLTVASSSLCGPEAQQKQHYADPPSEPCCCRETGLQTALSLTFLLISAVTMQGEFIMPDKIPNVGSPLWESSLAISPIMFSCRCSCQMWHGGSVSLDLKWYTLFKKTMLYK